MSDCKCCDRCGFVINKVDPPGWRKFRIDNGNHKDLCAPCFTALQFFMRPPAREQSEAEARSAELASVNG